MKRLQLSIAMTAYNGSRFIQQQLDSIADQTRLPDELVVCDDCSTDDTVPIIQRFASTAPFSVRLFVNSQNLGFSHNFDQAISLTTGDIVFICDQDDVWYSDKLRRCAEIFEKSPDIGWCFSDANLVDQQLQPLGYTAWERFDFGASQQDYFRKNRSFQFYIKHPFLMGASVAFRSAFIPLILPSSEQWLYDAWITTLLVAVANAHPISEPMYAYRQHDQQAMGVMRKSIWRKYIEARKQESPQFFLGMCEQYVTLRERLLTAVIPDVSTDVIEMLDRKIEFCKIRAHIRSYPHVFRPPLILREMFANSYQQYAQGWKTLARDFFV